MIPAGKVCRTEVSPLGGFRRDSPGIGAAIVGHRLKFRGECGNIVQNYVRRRNYAMKSRNRTLLLVFLVAVILILGALGVLWYYTANMDRSGWVQQNGYYYYLDASGEPVSGWLEQDGNQYYFGVNRAMVTGWQEIDGNHYYFGGDGVMRTGWLELNGQTRYLREDGTPAQGWEYADGARRFFLEDGLLATGWQTADGIRRFFSEDGTPVSGWLTQDEGSYYLNDDGSPVTGLTTLDGSTYYFYMGSGLMAQGLVDLEDGRHFFGEDGVMQTGWQTLGEDTFYFDENGAMHTGWLQEDEYSYYFLEDGTMAVSPTVIDGETCFFTPAGIYVLLVNYRYAMPDSRQPDLVRYGEWARVARVAEQSLRQMILDCRATGIECWLNCGYRTRDEQKRILEERTLEYQEDGLSYQDAYNKALETVALPGYSEHETGLAMDIVCSVTPTWLHEHCWEYGFILRYPENKSDITGISYEHWHYRYVGTKVSMAMKDTGMCLEEYVGAA